MTSESLLDRKQVRVRVEERDLETWSWGRNFDGKAAVVGGTVIEAHPDEDELKAGNVAMAYIAPPSGETSGTLEGTITVDRIGILRKPASMQLKVAVALAKAYSDAATLLHSHLDVLIPDTMELFSELTTYAKYYDDPPRYTDNKREVLILGGETHLGVALVHLLRLSDKCKVHESQGETFRTYVTARMDSQYDLLQRCVHLIMLGADMAIDGAADDLLHHVNRTFDFAFDVNGATQERPEILSKMNPEAVLVDSSNTAEARSQERVEIPHKLVETLLQEAATAFEEVAVPECSFDDDE